MYILDVFIVQLLAIQMVTDITPQGVMFLSLCSIQHIFYKCRHYFLLVKGCGLLSNNAFLGSLSWYTRFHFVDLYILQAYFLECLHPYFCLVLCHCACKYIKDRRWEINRQLSTFVVSLSGLQAPRVFTYQYFSVRPLYYHNVQFLYNFIYQYLFGSFSIFLPHVHQHFILYTYVLLKIF